MSDMYGGALTPADRSSTNLKRTPCVPPLFLSLQVPNSSPTAASASSDMYGGAVLDACRQINERLQPFKEKMPGAHACSHCTFSMFDAVKSSDCFYLWVRLRSLQRE